MKLPKQEPGSSTTAIFMLGLVGLIASGCTSLATSRGQQGENNLSAHPLNQTAQVASTENTSTINADHSNRQAVAVDSPDQFGLREGMSYQEAREILIQKGWQPHLGGDSPNLSSTSVKELFELGYQEVKDCSGTGMGLCRFEFTNKSGELLVVSAAMAESKNTERVVWRWFIEKGSIP